MWRAVLVYAALALACGVARAQPTLCQVDEQCSSGYYCEAHLCRECLSCETLRREPSLHANRCVTSPSQCGDCLTGLVYDSETDRCVEGSAPGPARPHLVWVAVVACLAVVAALVAVVLVYLYRNPDTFKMTASARASVHHAPSPASAAESEAAAASAPPPQPPPPYSPQYPPAPDPYIEESSPLVKRGGAREAAGAQAAQVFNNPNYVHGPYYTHSPEPGEASPAASPEPFEPFAPHDEDTMESLWRPAGEPDHPAHAAHAASPAAAAAAAAAAGSSAGAAAGEPCRDLEPAAKVPRLAQDTNNNKNAEGRGGGGTSVTLNFNLNLSTSAVQQLNNVSL